MPLFVSGRRGAARGEVEMSTAPTQPCHCSANFAQKEVKLCYIVSPSVPEQVIHSCWLTSVPVLDHTGVRQEPKSRTSHDACLEASLSYLASHVSQAHLYSTTSSSSNEPWPCQRAICDPRGLSTAAEVPHQPWSEATDI